MGVVLGLFAFAALVGMVAFLCRCPVLVVLKPDHERETREPVVVVTPPTQVHHMHHHVHHVQTASAVPHAYVAPPATPSAAEQGPTCPCGCGLPLSQVQGAPALGPAPDAVAAVGRVLPALERRQR